MEWILGLAGSILLAGAAYWKRALSGSGVWAAIAVGTCLYAAGGPVWYGLMIGFFATSTFLTKWKKHRKARAEAKYEKSGRRDAGQVLANGGAAALICLLNALYPSWWSLAFFWGIMATVTADTWATEVGGLSKSDPRSILTWRKVPKGTSGGVSPLGWLASAAGAGFIGAAGVILLQWEVPASDLPSFNGAYWAWLVMAATVSGWIGTNVDSLLGASVQALYRCPVCGDQTESASRCGSVGVLVHGWIRMNNDVVNLLSSVAGGLVMVLLTGIWRVLTGA